MVSFIYRLNWNVNRKSLTFCKSLTNHGSDSVWLDNNNFVDEIQQADDRWYERPPQHCVELQKKKKVWTITRHSNATFRQYIFSWPIYWLSNPLLTCRNLSVILWNILVIQHVLLLQYDQIKNTYLQNQF